MHFSNKQRSNFCPVLSGRLLAEDSFCRQEETTAQQQHRLIEEGLIEDTNQPSLFISLIIFDLFSSSRS
jgi:hypothetical protein